MGSGPVSALHDWAILPTTALLAFSGHVPADRLYSVVVLGHVPRIYAAQRVPRSEQYL
jgi:hypothetical protein